jgi:alpha-1,3-fucosyltransferase
LKAFKYFNLQVVLSFFLDFSFNINFYILDQQIEEIFSKKTKTAVGMISQCGRPSRRDDLIRELQKFIDVDVYGECGNLTCPRFPDVCVDLNLTYKFYLAFENSLCIDYLTEKSFKVMNDYIIPVVYNGVEMSRFLPPKSYINANDFKTPEQLASYLNFLSNNVTEYVKYFWWKKHYKVDLTTFDVCEVCKKLNEPNLTSKRHVYENLKEWYSKDICSEPKIEF